LIYCSLFNVLRPFSLERISFPRRCWTARSLVAVMTPFSGLFDSIAPTSKDPNPSPLFSPCPRIFVNRFSYVRLVFSLQPFCERAPPLSRQLLSFLSPSRCCFFLPDLFESLARLRRSCFPRIARGKSLLVPPGRFFRESFVELFSFRVRAVMFSPSAHILNAGFSLADPPF